MSAPGRCPHQDDVRTRTMTDGREMDVKRYLPAVLALLVLAVPSLSFADDSSPTASTRRSLPNARDDHGMHGSFGDLGLHLAPLAGRGRIASSDAIRVRGYRSLREH